MGVTQWKITRVFSEHDEALINRRLPRELLLRVFSYLDIISLCRSAQVQKRESMFSVSYVLSWFSKSLGEQTMECVGSGWLQLAEGWLVWVPSWHWGNCGGEPGQEMWRLPQEPQPQGLSGAAQSVFTFCPSWWPFSAECWWLRPLQLLHLLL